MGRAFQSVQPVMRRPHRNKTALSQILIERRPFGSGLLIRGRQMAGEAGADTRFCDDPDPPAQAGLIGRVQFNQDFGSTGVTSHERHSIVGGRDGVGRTTQNATKRRG
jgi:hypothetical protein